MKSLRRAVYSLLLGIIVLSFNTIALASCGGNGGCGSSGEDEDYSGSYCDLASGCKCVDPMCSRNPCTSRAKCCQAFGNIGAATEY